MESVNGGAVSLIAEACLALQRPDLACAACAEICPSGAIVVAGQGVDIRPDACSGCARCVPACPTGALVSQAPSPQAGVLDCARVAPSDRSDGAVCVPCLGGVSAAWLREAALKGDVRLLDRGWCAACPVGGAPAPWAASTAQVAGELAGLGLHARIVVERVALPVERALPAPKPQRRSEAPLSRRQLFARIVEPAAPIVRSGSGADKKPPRRAAQIMVAALEQRLAALARLAAPAALPAALFPQITELQAGRTEFRLVAGLCPTGALERRQDTGHETLWFDAARCLGCARCTTGAVQGSGLGIEHAPQGTYGGARLLGARPLAICPQCGQQFIARAARQLCDGCHKDHDLAAFALGSIPPRHVAGDTSTEPLGAQITT
jgi:Fe-S-cluster-containing hydrogenase component 2